MKLPPTKSLPSNAEYDRYKRNELDDELRRMRNNKEFSDISFNSTFLFLNKYEVKTIDELAEYSVRDLMGILRKDEGLLYYGEFILDYRMPITFNRTLGNHVNVKRKAALTEAVKHIISDVRKALGAKNMSLKDDKVFTREVSRDWYDRRIMNMRKRDQRKANLMLQPV